MIVSVTPKSLLKTQLFEEKAIFPVKKKFQPACSRIIECDNPEGNVCREPNGILTNTVKVTRSFL